MRWTKLRMEKGIQLYGLNVWPHTYIVGEEPEGYSASYKDRTNNSEAVMLTKEFLPTKRHAELLCENHYEKLKKQQH